MGLGHEDFKGHVESGCEQEDSPAIDKKVEKASAEMLLVKGRRKLAYPENLYMCQMLS